MAPAWEELADKFENDATMTIAHFDATANDMRELNDTLNNNLIPLF